MCLSVNLNYHKVKNDKPIALVAKQSILVYKVLEVKGNYYRTPYMIKTVNFDDEYGMFFYKTTRFGIDRVRFFDQGREYREYNVSKGIHSHIDFDKANRDINYLKQFFNLYLCSAPNIHYAIIPKGSKFYIGAEGDIVSSNLVVFENEAKYNENKEYFGDEPIEFSEYWKKFGTELDSK